VAWIKDVLALITIAMLGLFAVTSVWAVVWYVRTLLGREFNLETPDLNLDEMHPVSANYHARGADLRRDQSAGERTNEDAPATWRSRTDPREWPRLCGSRLRTAPRGDPIHTEADLARMRREDRLDRLAMGAFKFSSLVLVLAIIGTFANVVFSVFFAGSRWSWTSFAVIGAILIVGGGVPWLIHAVLDTRAMRKNPRARWERNSGPLPSDDRDWEKWATGELVNEGKEWRTPLHH
jgi:hypothetical protein